MKESRILSGIPNLDRLREAAGSFRNNAPFSPSTDGNRQKRYITISGIVACNPIDLDIKEIDSVISDNVDLDKNSFSGQYKVIYYYSSDKSKEMQSPEQDILKLSENDNKYKLFLVNLAQGIGGGRVFIDSSKQKVPSKGDRITFQAIEGDHAFHSPKIEIQQTSNTSPTPVVQEKKGDVTNERSPTAAPPVVGNLNPQPSPPSSSGGKKIKAPSSIKSPIRQEILNSRTSFFESNSLVSIAEWRYILDPEFRRAAKQIFPSDVFLQDQFVAFSLLETYTESTIRIPDKGFIPILRVGNWLYAHPVSKKMVYGEKDNIGFEVKSSCSRKDKPPKCDSPEWKGQAYAPFSYATYNSPYESALGHAKWLKVNFKGQEFGEEKGFRYRREKLFGYKALIKYMKLEIVANKKGLNTIVATEKTYEELKKFTE